jgi:hypothetical protein
MFHCCCSLGQDSIVGSDRTGHRRQKLNDPVNDPELTIDRLLRNDRGFHGSEHVLDRRFHAIRRQCHSGQHNLAIGKDYLQSPVRLGSVTDKCRFEQ